ncbi:MAG: aldehyde dehydrogenase, partial [Pseudomonas sp.]
MSSVPVYQNYINGQFADSAEHLEVFNPATGALLSRVPAASGEEVDRALAAART